MLMTAPQRRYKPAVHQRRNKKVCGKGTEKKNLTFRKQVVEGDLSGGKKKKQINLSKKPNEPKVPNLT